MLLFVVDLGRHAIGAIVKFKAIETASTDLGWDISQSWFTTKELIGL